MKKIVDKETNSVAFGSYNEPIELNFEDYRLVNFFGKKLSQGKTLRNLKNLIIIHSLIMIKLYQLE